MDSPHLLLPDQRKAPFVQVVLQALRWTSQEALALHVPNRQDHINLQTTNIILIDHPLPQIEEIRLQVWVAGNVHTATAHLSGGNATTVSPDTT